MNAGSDPLSQNDSRGLTPTYHHLDPRAITVGRITAGIATLVIVVATFWGVLGAILASLFESGPVLAVSLLALPAWFLLTALLAWVAYRVPEISHQRTSYCVDDRGIEIRRGIVWRRVINVPRTRVQHLDVSQGPLERRYGLGTLTIHTAGTQFAKVELGGLEHSRALRIREHLLPTGIAGDAV